VAVHLPPQRLRACEVRAERFLDHQAPPAAARRARKPRLAESLCRRAEQRRRQGEVKQHGWAEPVPQAAQSFGIEFAAQIVETGRETLPRRGLEIRREHAQRPMHVAFESRWRPVLQGVADDLQIRCQAQSVQTVQRRHEQPPGQVAGGAEDHQRGFFVRRSPHR
jgi:hypothetical protein